MFLIFTIVFQNSFTKKIKQRSIELQVDEIILQITEGIDVFFRETQNLCL